MSWFSVKETPFKSYTIILVSVPVWVQKRCQTKFLPTCLICIINQAFSFDSERLASPVPRLWFLPPLRFKSLKGQSSQGPGIWGLGRRVWKEAELREQDRAHQELVIFPADTGLPAESHCTFFSTCISELTHTRIRTMGLDRDNSHIIQIKAIQQVLVFQHHPCQREYSKYTQ